jgi:hypothetical protein
MRSRRIREGASPRQLRQGQLVGEAAPLRRGHGERKLLFRPGYFTPLRQQFPQQTPRLDLDVEVSAPGAATQHPPGHRQCGRGIAHVAMVIRPGYGDVRRKDRGAGGVPAVGGLKPGPDRRPVIGQQGQPGLEDMSGQLKKVTGRVFGPQRLHVGERLPNARIIAQGELQLNGRAAPGEASGSKRNRR